MIGIVLGSGLGPLADAVVVEREVSFTEAGLPSSFRVALWKSAD